MAQIIQYSTSTSGTVTCQNTQQDVRLIHDATLTASLTIALPASPADGQIVNFISPGGVTALTLTTTVGSIINSLTSLVAGTPATYMWYNSQSKWYKIG